MTSPRSDLLPEVSVPSLAEPQAQLDQVHSQLALYARDLKRTVDAERQKSQALEEANARLAILDRLKTDFLTFIAHELRTPLSTMTVLDLLDPHDEPQALAEMIALIRKGYERLEDFVEKGIEYFQWLAMDPAATPATVTDVTSVVRQVVAQHIALHPDASTLVCEIPTDSCLVHGEAEHLARIVHILLDNAHKFSGQDGHILIRLGSAKGKITLVVADHGCGFPPEMGTELFRPFTIANIMNHTQGAGLSLALAHAIVAAYGGSIHAHSPGPQQGATFTVELPEVSLL